MPQKGYKVLILEVLLLEAVLILEEKKKRKRKPTPGDCVRSRENVAGLFQPACPDNQTFV